MGDLGILFEGIPLAETNTSMTINATAMWLLALYQVVAEEQGADISALTGTTQNDIIKEYLSRGNFAFAPGPSMRLHRPLTRWWEQMLIGIQFGIRADRVDDRVRHLLDSIRDSGQVSAEEMCKMRAMVELWDEVTQSRYGVLDPRQCCRA